MHEKAVGFQHFKKEFSRSGIDSSDGCSAGEYSSRAQDISDSTLEDIRGKEEKVDPKDSCRHNILKGKTAVVTGAARGIGRAVAVALAKSGANVAGIDICALVDPHSDVTPATRADLETTGRLVNFSSAQFSPT